MIWRKVPFGSTINNPRNAIPWSCTTPHAISSHPLPRALRRTHLEEHAIIARNLHAFVRHKLDLEVWSESSLVALRVGPGEVRVLRVGRNGEDFGVESCKGWELGVEGEDLCLRVRGSKLASWRRRAKGTYWADEGEVHRVDWA